MLPQIKEYPIETVYTYAEWEKEYKRNKAQERKEKLHTAGQKLLGIGLLLLGIIGCLAMPEDAGGFVITSLLGMARNCRKINCMFQVNMLNYMPYG